MTESDYTTEYTAHFTQTARYVAKFGFPWEVAKEIAQVAWMRAWEKSGQYRGDCQFSTWVSGIARNEALTRRRLKKHQGEEPLGTHHVDAPHPLRKMIAEQAVARCPRAFRPILRMRYWEGMSWVDIAAKVGAPESTVKVKHFRMMGEIRKRIAG